MSPQNKLLPHLDQFKCPTGNKGRTIAKLMNQRHSDLTDWGLKKVKIRADFFILDIGCGGGKTFTKLAKLAPQGKVFGIDHSPDMVEYATQENKDLINHNRVNIVESSVENTKFLDNFFDLITGVETYYFWPNLSDAFQEIKRILKPDGKLLLVNEMIKDGNFEVENAEIISKTQVRLVELKEMQEMLLSAGFVGVEVFSKKGSAWNVVFAQKP